jgi:hypothetical protein
MNGFRTVTTRVDPLGGTDHLILSLLQLHRVLTTPQLITLTARPERTIDYRLSRLRSRGLVDRTRPYAESGSAPYYWWLTRAGARLVEGTSPAPGKGTPNPLFLRHTAAIAGLFVAPVDAGPTVGLTLTEWRRDEDAWEDWTHYGQAGRIRPDAYAEVHLEVDGQDDSAGAFIEVDFATMDQARLRAKVARHRRYCQESVWWSRHPCCPALLVVTTSEARVNRFLAGAEKDRPRGSSHPSENPAHYDELVAACAAVVSPEDAVCSPVWRQGVGDASVTLSALLSPEVRQYRRVVARVEAARQRHEEHRRRHLVHDLVRHHRAIADAMGDDEVTSVLSYLALGPLNFASDAERWGEAHLDLVEETLAWWAAAKAGGATPAPPSVLAAWRAIYRQCWLAQAEVLLGANEAVSHRDPRLRRPAATVASGDLVSERELRPVGSRDGAQLHDDAMAEHEARRDRAVGSQLHALPLHRRLRADRAALEAAYDAEHLLVCPTCALPRNDDEGAPSFGRPRAPLACRSCGGPLVALVDAPDLPPALHDSIARIAARRERLGDDR